MAPKDEDTKGKGGGDSSGTTDDSSTKGDRTYTKKYVDDLKGNLKKERTKRQALEGELSSLNERVAAMEKAKLESEEDWKGLAEKKDTELQEALNRMAEINVELSDSRVMNQVFGAASKKGLRPDIAFKLLDRSALEIDNGEVLNMDGALDALVEDYPELLQPQAQVGTTSPGTSSGPRETDQERLRRLETGGPGWGGKTEGEVVVAEDLYEKAVEAGMGDKPAKGQ
ncbi:MAG: hypothetical protein GTO63_27350 [Anaerolineae bacterium]|nr:hypothetical protein [Anaerolineae bacterium]NIN98444.1 hypothetical protein [Anaerolineae bacterium]